MSEILPRLDYDTLSKRDGRTREAKLLRDIKADLIASVGGAPTLVQRVRINLASELQLRLSEMDAETASGEYLALANALNNLLDQLGLAGAVETPCSVVQASEGATA